VAVGYAGQAQCGVVIIRSATEADIDAIYAVHVAAMRRLQDTAPQGDERAQKGVDAYISGRRPSHVAAEMREQRIVVMEDEGKILGFAALHVPKIEITMVFVNPEHQRKGVGRALLAELESIAIEAGLDVVKLQATGTAIEFYLKTGYQSDPPVESGAGWASMKKNVS
jgi:ribosomal protein S18 acetylase RimI-like enzyme